MAIAVEQAIISCFKCMRLKLIGFIYDKPGYCKHYSYFMYECQICIALSVLFYI